MTYKFLFYYSIPHTNIIFLWKLNSEKQIVESQLEWEKFETLVRPSHSLTRLDVIKELMEVS